MSKSNLFHALVSLPVLYVHSLIWTLGKKKKEKEGRGSMKSRREKNRTVTSFQRLERMRDKLLLFGLAGRVAGALTAAGVTCGVAAAATATAGAAAVVTAHLQVHTQQKKDEAYCRRHGRAERTDTEIISTTCTGPSKYMSGVQHMKTYEKLDMVRSL